MDNFWMKISGKYQKFKTKSGYQPCWMREEVPRSPQLSSCVHDSLRLRMLSVSPRWSFSCWDLSGLAEKIWNFGAENCIFCLEMWFYHRKMQFFMQNLIFFDLNQFRKPSKSVEFEQVCQFSKTRQGAPVIAKMLKKCRLWRDFR